MQSTSVVLILIFKCESMDFRSNLYLKQARLPAELKHITKQRKKN